MTKLSKLSIATIAVVLGLASAALAGSSHGRSQSAPGHTGAQTTSSTGTSSTPTSPPSNARAYGRLCQGQSKQHVPGKPGTLFSMCVHDMAQMAKNPKTNPHRACANMPKTHVAGKKGTPYSQCVVAAAKMRGEHNHA